MLYTFIQSFRNTLTMGLGLLLFSLFDIKFEFSLSFVILTIVYFGILLMVGSILTDLKISIRRNNLITHEYFLWIGGILTMLIGTLSFYLAFKSGLFSAIGGFNLLLLSDGFFLLSILTLVSFISFFLGFIGMKKLQITLNKVANTPS